MPKAEVTLPASVSSVPTARHFIDSILSGWGLGELVWTATLVISELAANAALHAHSVDFHIRVSTQVDGVRLEVADESRRPPQQRRYSAEATTGRGLWLVAELAAEWGVVTEPGGKTVWAVVRASTGSGARDDIADELGADELLAAYQEPPLADEAGRPTGLSRGAAVAA